MPDLESITAIVEQYRKHQWHLRQFVLTPAALASMKRDLAQFGVDIVEGELDAAWFSRTPAEGEVAWEVRNLGTPAFALVEYLDEADDDFELKLKATEERLRESVSKKRVS